MTSASPTTAHGDCAGPSGGWGPKPVKTYAAPEPVALLSPWFLLTTVALLSSYDAPTTTVSPDTATEKPKRSVVRVGRLFSPPPLFSLPWRGVTYQPRATPWEQRSDVNHKSPEGAPQGQNPCLNRSRRIWSI
jgi:hypothetical protein